MPVKQVRVADTFRNSTIRAIFSIFLFLTTYIGLILLAICFTLLCGYLGIMLILFKPMFITLMLGIGLISMGILILVFLLKFMFSRHKVDRSHLVEISKADQPELFEFIRDIVKSVKTSFPKKIYMSSDVNAAVFYDSSFWSMFLPIRKNLQIGAGLVNVVSVTEFKAILAHEFGHFSQKSMKVGSYVYNVNKVIYNMLYENEGFGTLAQGVANASGYFVYFVRIAVWIVNQIQWVLRKVYEVVNISYMRLSREMEFHADEVAASVTGSQPMSTVLLRLDLAEHSYSTVLDYYNSKIKDAVKTDNIYPQQQYILQFLGKESQLPFVQELPQVTLNHVSRFNQSKLVINDQWASHPSIEDRVRRLENLAYPAGHTDNRIAIFLFQNPGKLQEQLTRFLFSTVEYKSPEKWIQSNQFIEEFTTRYIADSFDAKYNKYYDSKDVAAVKEEDITPEMHGIRTSMEMLFENKKVDLVYSAYSLARDIATLKIIMEGNHRIRYFEYDGEKYEPIDCHYLVPSLEKKLDDIKQELMLNDQLIFIHFIRLAEEKNCKEEYLKKYSTLVLVDKLYDEYVPLYNQLITETEFIKEVTPFEEISKNLKKASETESQIKLKIRELLDNSAFAVEINEERLAVFNKYLMKDWVYFIHPEYDNEALTILFDAMGQFRAALSEAAFRYKKDLLEYQVSLELEK